MTTVVNRNGISFDIDNIATDLNGKADVDLTNVNDSGTSRGAGWTMPSDTYEDITAGATGSTYTAPANGWFVLNVTSTSTHGWARLSVDGLVYTTQIVDSSNLNLDMHVPAAKNAEIGLSYGSVTIKVFRFIYAQGSESEAS